MAPYVSVMSLFLAFVAALIITAWYGGFLSAMFATVLSAFTIDYYFVPPVTVLHSSLRRVPHGIFSRRSPGNIVLH